MKKLLLTGIALVGAALVFAQPRLVAHRGFYTTPGSDENTISSLINAQQLGVYGVEFDVNRTSDGELIVVHGPKVGDRLDAQWDTYAEISRVVLPGGNRIPIRFGRPSMPMSLRRRVFNSLTACMCL